MKIARVFARWTRGTPNDALAFVGEPGLFPPEVDQVHISVAFTWDLPEAERLARAWEGIAPVRIGGPATVIQAKYRSSCGSRTYRAGVHMIEIAEARVETPLDELTFEELDQLGRRITEWIACADEQHDQVMVDLFIQAESHLNRLKGRL